MRELRDDTFLRNKNDDAYEHVERILNIVSLFNILGVTHYAVMLRVFPITLIGAAKRWVDRLSPGTINTWDLPKNTFIQWYCPPSKIAKQLEEIHNFKHEGDETLYQAWERRVSNDSSNGIVAIINKLDILVRDMKKLKENVHAIQVGCENCRGAHLNKECPLNEELEKDYQAKAANEVPDLSVGQCNAIFANNEAPTDEASSKGTTELQGVTFISNDNVQVPKEMEEGQQGVLPCQLPPKELNTVSFTLPYTIGSKKKTVVVTSDPLAFIAEKRNVSRSKEKVVVSLDSEGSEADDFCELKKITAFLAKAFNRRKFYSKPTNNNLRTSSSSQSANKKQEFVKTDTKKVEKKDDEKKRDMSRVICYNCKKEGHFAKYYKKAK
nr:hypothetical protein [Tanacetum cinerariifolium]